MSIRIGSHALWGLLIGEHVGLFAASLLWLYHDVLPQYDNIVHALQDDDSAAILARTSIAFGSVGAAIGFVIGTILDSLS